MPRPKGSFKSAEEIAAMTQKERERYWKNHKDYLKNGERRKNNPGRPRKNARKPWTKTRWEDRQTQLDKLAVDWDAFPESMMREWLRAHCKTRGEARIQAARWLLTNGELQYFLNGIRLPKIAGLQSMQLDTGIVMSKILEDYEAIRAKVMGDFSND